MTLIITAIKKDVVWQASDNRISVNRKYRDDNSVKQLIIQYPEGTALLAWAGLAEIPDKNRTKTTQWVCEILRGETRGLRATLEQIRDRASQEISNYHLLIFSIAAFINKNPYYFEITNGPYPLKKNFTLYTEVVINPKAFIGGGGGDHLAYSKKSEELLLKMLTKSGKPFDFENLLAVINKRISEHCSNCTATISPSCVTVFVDSSGKSSQPKGHGGKSEIGKGLVVPHVLLGIDTSELMKAMLNSAKLPPEEFRKEWEKATISAITPRVRKSSNP